MIGKLGSSCKFPLLVLVSSLECAAIQVFCFLIRIRMTSWCLDLSPALSCGDSITLICPLGIRAWGAIRLPSQSDTQNGQGSQSQSSTEGTATACRDWNDLLDTFTETEVREGNLGNQATGSPTPGTVSC